MNLTAKNALLIATFSLAFALPQTASAEWTGNVEGEQIIDGDNQGSRLRFKMSNAERPLDQAVYVDWLRTDAGSAYAVGYEPRYWFSDMTYVFGLGSFRTSSDDTIDSVRDLGAGLGIKLLDSETQELTAELGGRQTVTKFGDGVVTFDNEDSVSANSTFASLSGEQSISDLLKLALSLDYSKGETSARSLINAGIKLRIPGGSVVYNYSLQNTKPDIGESVETSGSSVSFQYDF